MENRVVSRARCRWVRPSILLAVGAMLLALALPVGVPTAAAQPAQRDLVDTLRADPRFSTMVRAVETAGLVETLKGPGPYTLFAPPNEAFAKLPNGSLDALLQNPAELRKLLTYHVAPGIVTSAQAVQVPTLPSVLGPQIKVTVNGGTVLMNTATVIEKDIAASNGIIHVVDGVWLQAALGPNALPTAGMAGSPVLAALVAGLALVAAGLAVGRASFARPTARTGR